MSINDTPRANRLHIGIFGRRNAGKSTLVNALTGQNTALVSDEPGTTTDPVYKSMELHPIGPVVFIDTAGFDDEGELGKLRVERTREALDRTDIGILVIDDEAAAKMQDHGMSVNGDSEEVQWLRLFEEKNTPVIIAVNQRRAESSAGSCECSGSCDADAADDINTAGHVNNAGAADDAEIPHIVVYINAKAGCGMDELRRAIEEVIPKDFLRRRILGDMIDDKSLVMLVMPQDIQAPKGRLILPQVQTLRELLDKKCTAVSATADGFTRALDSLNRAPDLIITDSQCFGQVWEEKPKESALTSFSVLFAAYKGDIDIFTKGVSAIDDMTEDSRILIAEACTHVPLTEDIGREKIPNLLRKRIGSGVQITNVCGSDFPHERELREFDLIIHCGACMFNRKHVMNRISAAEHAGVPITNYGVVLAKLTGILDKIELLHSSK